MNTQPDNFDDLWQRWRDGELSDGQRAEFEHALADRPADRAYLELESALLAELESGVKPLETTGPLFAERVMQRWDSATALPQGDGDAAGLATVGRPGRAQRRWRSALVSATWVSLAACVALVLYMQRSSSTPAPAPPRPGTVVFVPPPQPVEPVSVLVRQAKDTITSEPIRIARSIRTTVAGLSIERVVRMIELPVPDPAQFVEPTPPNEPPRRTPAGRSDLDRTLKKGNA